MGEPPLAPRPVTSSGPKIQFLPPSVTETVLKPRTIPIFATDEKFCSALNGEVSIKRIGKKNINGTSPNFTFDVTVPSNKWKFILGEKVLSYNTSDGQSSKFFIRRKLLTVSDQYVLLKEPDTEDTVLSSGAVAKPKLIELCRFTNCSVPARNKGKIIAEFVDKCNKQKLLKRVLMLKGDLDMGDLTLYLGDPKKDGERIVARIRKVKTTGAKAKTSDCFRMEFSGGVDVIVIIGLFVIFGEVQLKNPQMRNVPVFMK